VRSRSELSDTLGYAGEEYAIQQVFQKAREMSPCVLIFEDIDSLITPQVPFPSLQYILKKADRHSRTARSS
jgi:hypothetical protein